MIISSSEWVLGDRPTALRRSKAAGFDAIELDALPGADVNRIRDDLESAGLQVPSLCWSWNTDHELGSPDPASRIGAQKYLLGALEQALELGATQLVVIPACREVPWDADEPRIRGIERAAASIAQVLADAPAGIGIAIEALRKDESFIMNTLAQADELRTLIGDPRAGLLADVYHMAEEESEPIQALQQFSDQITLLHFAAPDRTAMLATTPGIDALVRQVRTMPTIRSMTLEFEVGDDGTALAESLDFARSV